MSDSNPANPGPQPLPKDLPPSSSRELHVCAGLNACEGHGRSGTNACAGTGDCATVNNSSCHGNNECRGQGGCGTGGSLGSQQDVPGENLCRGKGSCYVPLNQGINANRKMVAATEVVNGSKGGYPITGVYEGRHVWQVARLLFEKRMMASGRAYTTRPELLGAKSPADPSAATEREYSYFGPPPADTQLGPLPSDDQPDEPLYKPKKSSFGGKTHGKKSSFGGETHGA